MTIYFNYDIIYNVRKRGNDKMNIIIFDTETIGKQTNDIINVGYKIIDLNIQQATFKVLKQRDYIETDLINNRIYCINDDFVGNEKYEKFIHAIERKQAIKRNINAIIRALDNDIKRYNVLFGYAYNCNFDIDKFERQGYKFDIPIFDIWGYAYNYICNTTEYIEYMKENNLLTPSEQYIQTSVEGVCKYLYKNNDFVEEHTALSDVQHETNILVECVKRGADITRESKKTGRLLSDKTFNKTIKLPDGSVHTIEYKKCYERNGTITYK